MAGLALNFVQKMISSLTVRLGLLAPCYETQRALRSVWLRQLRKLG